MPRNRYTLQDQAGDETTQRSAGGAHVIDAAREQQRGAEGERKRPGLPASGMFLINPPFTLKAALKTALPQMVELLAQDKHATHTLESGG